MITPRKTFLLNKFRSGEKPPKTPKANFGCADTADKKKNSGHVKSNTFYLQENLTHIFYGGLKTKLQRDFALQTEGCGKWGEKRTVETGNTVL